MITISIQTLGDAIARYSIKTPVGSTSTNNNVPKTVTTNVSAVVSAYRRIHGVDPPDGDLGDMTWLSLENVRGPNLSSKDRPLFADQSNDGASVLLEPGTVRRLFENYKTGIYAVSKHIATVDMPDADKERLLAAYKKSRADFYAAGDPYIKAEKQRTKERHPSARQLEKNVPWMVLKERGEVVVGYIEATMTVDKNDIVDVTADEMRKVQRGLQFALCTLIPPLRSVFENARFVAPGDENEKELASTDSPNYVLIGDDVVQLVINKTKNDRRSDDEAYDPDVDYALDHANTLRLDLTLPVAARNGDSEDTMQRKMDRANVIHVLGKFGFDPLRLGKLLRQYHKWMQVVMGDRNPKQFLFCNLKKGSLVTPLKAEGVKSRLHEATKRIVGKPLGVQMLRPIFLTWSDGEGPSMDEREIIADAMTHSVATQMGNYTKKAGARKRLGEGVVEDRVEKARVAAAAPNF